MKLHKKKRKDSIQRLSSGGRGGGTYEREVNRWYQERKARGRGGVDSRASIGVGFLKRRKVKGTGH